MNTQRKPMMKRGYFLCLLCLLSFPLFAQKDARLIMGFYYPSISDTVDRTDIEVSLTFWTQELTEETEINESKAILFDSIETMRLAFENREIDMIIAPPLLIAKHFKRSDLADGFVGVRKKGSPNSLLLLVNQKIKKLSDLRGKRLIIPENDELAEVFLQTFILKTFKQGYKQVFSEVFTNHKNNRVVLDLFFNKADAALVYESAFEVMSELNPQIKAKIQIMESYPVKSKNFSFFHKDYPLKNILTEKALNYGEFPRARQILAVYKTPELDYCRVDDLKPFDNLYREFNKLTNSEKK